MFGLRGGEVVAFGELCNRVEPITVGGLAASLGWSKSAVSRAVSGLASKGLAEVQRTGRSKRVLPSKTAHSAALKELLASYPHVAFDELLAGSALRVLSGMIFAPASVVQIARRSFTPEITVRRVLAKLLERGLIFRRRQGAYEIALQGLDEFVQAYAAISLEAERSGVSGSLIVRGANGLLRTSSPSVPKSMVLTGLSAFGRYGVSVVQTDFRDYYFNAFGKPHRLGIEEVVIHAILRSTAVSSGREVSFALLVLYKNRKKINEVRLFECAGDFGAEYAVKHSWEFVDCVISGKPVPKSLADFGSKTGGPLLPDAEEFRELVRQYG